MDRLTMECKQDGVEVVIVFSTSYALCRQQYNIVNWLLYMLETLYIIS